MAQESVSRTKELIIKIQNAMHAGALPCSDIPIEDIKSCVRGELNVHENTFTAAQFQELGIRFNSFSSRITDGETDASKIDMFIDGMLICLETVSEAVCSLADRKYWSLIHASRLNDPEVAEIIDFVDRRHDVRLLPYDFVDNYMNTPCEVGYDPECGMHYVPYKTAECISLNSGMKNVFQAIFRLLWPSRILIHPTVIKKKDSTFRIMRSSPM